MTVAMNHDLTFNDGCIFGLKCRPRWKSTRGMATTAPDEEPTRRESPFRLYTGMSLLKTS